MNDEKNYNFNTPGIIEWKRGNWYQLEVGQNIGQNDEYIYYIKLNGQILHQKENKIPRGFSEKQMKFYAANDISGATATNTKIRNVRFKTENDGTDDWFVIDGSPCWDTCDQMGGKCDHCGANGFCCSATKHSVNGDCTTDMIDTIKNSEYANKTGHMCVSKLDEASCMDWATDRDVFCDGGELEDSPIVTPGGLTQCQDQCLNVGQNCMGVVLERAEAEVKCHLHSEMTSCQPQEGAISSTKMFYSCKDNSNCEGSYVRLRDQNMGQMIGQDKTYCGKETPPNFFSYGSAAQIKIQIDSETHGKKISMGDGNLSPTYKNYLNTPKFGVQIKKPGLVRFDKIRILGLVPEFRAKFKAEICDRIYTDTSGVIFSPNHPDLYPNQLDCTIQISLKDSQLKIQVRDSRMDM